MSMQYAFEKFVPEMARFEAIFKRPYLTNHLAEMSKLSVYQPDLIQRICCQGHSPYQILS